MLKSKLFGKLVRPAAALRPGLVLNRELEESLEIITPHGQQITITVVRIRHGRSVRLHVAAPKDVTIFRSELEAA
jgi:carbon storage regulator CsrA